MSPIHEWEKLYQAATLETDWSKIEERIQKAETAMKGRLQELSLNQGGTPEENRAIQKAVEGLAVLRQEAAAWHARKGKSD